MKLSFKKLNFRRLSGGVHVPHLKSTALQLPQRIPVPKTVTIPMSMHIGAPANPIVKAGDLVKVGQPIADAGGVVSAPIHSSVSGKVKRIEDMLASNGKQVSAIVIETDGEQAVWEDISPPQIKDYESFLSAVASSGIVGLGGAGFPTAVKLRVRDLKLIDAIIINGAECEPYITSDTYTMLTDSDLVWQGIELLQKYMQAKRIIIGIEKNKPECVEKFETLAQNADGVEVMALPSVYPQGGEKVLIFNTIGKIVPEGGLPIDVGAVVINCTTLAAIARYINTGMPLTEKCVTVDGSAVNEPKNVIAPIGTPMSELFEFCGGFSSEPKKVLYGGPMMGISVPNVSAPILKTTNAIIALDERDAITPPTTGCIRCGRCIDRCPLRLMPAEIERAYKTRDGARLQKLKVNLCMECGCCAYICPARRPLVQVNKLAKIVMNEYQTTLKKQQEAASGAEAKGGAQ